MPPAPHAASHTLLAVFPSLQGEITTHCAARPDERIASAPVAAAVTANFSAAMMMLLPAAVYAMKCLCVDCVTSRMQCLLGVGTKLRAQSDGPATTD